MPSAFFNRFVIGDVIFLKERGWRYSKATGWSRVVDHKMMTARSVQEAIDREFRREANAPRRCKIQQRVGKGKKAKWVWVASARCIHDAEQCLFRDFFCQGRVVAFDEKYTSSVPTGDEKDDGR